MAGGEHRSITQPPTQSGRGSAITILLKKMSRTWPVFSFASADPEEAKEAMKTTMMLMVIALAVKTAVQAGQPQAQVIVFLQNTAVVPPQVFVPAEGMATRMFAGIGIHLVWRCGKLPAKGGSRFIGIKLMAHAPHAYDLSVLADALPYEGVHIRVFYDRIASFDQKLQPVVLAHVMVHEITHILEGISRHSATGIMRAQWITDDHRMMMRNPQPFAQEDVELIYLGLKAR